MNTLLTLEAALFMESCEVTILEGEDAQIALAECLAGSGLELAPLGSAGHG